MMPSVKRGNGQSSDTALIAYMEEVPVEQNENKRSLNENIHYS